MDFGESPEQSLEREMFEELDMRVKVDKLHGVFTHINANEQQILLMVYFCQPGPREPRIIECEDVVYVEVNQAKELELAPLDRVVLASLEQY